MRSSTSGFGNDIDQGQLNDMASVASYIKPTVNDLQHLVDDIEIDTCEGKYRFIQYWSMKNTSIAPNLCNRFTI